MILRNDQGEIVGDAKGGFNFQAGTSIRNVTHHAVNPCRTIKRDSPGLQRPLAGVLSFFFHLNDRIRPINRGDAIGMHREL